MCVGIFPTLVRDLYRWLQNDSKRGWRTEGVGARVSFTNLGDWFLASVGIGRSCDLPMKVPNPSPILNSSCAPMGPDTLPCIGAGVWRNCSGRQSLAFNERGQLSQAIPQFHTERMLHQRAPKSSCSAGGYDRQRTLVTRIDKPQ